ncbi:MAG TPA: co-chaperone GroES, partial [Myxococcota bacterium]|nr:co-chaperone GroES [Myxococcota bacterium]
MNLQPLGDLVLVRPIEAKEQTAGGLYLPDTARETPA